MNNFDVIRQDGRLLYEYIRGSHLYGLNNEDSDIDTSGVYVCTRDELFGCFGYKPQVTDSRHDNTWYEIGELVRLLLKSNPTVLESLFVPEDKVIGNIHPIMQMVIDQRDQFISKQCFNPFFGYAKSQIEKARGLNKKIVNPVTERLTPYDFIYTFKGQGNTKFSDWLNNRSLHQEFCGLVNVPNMHDIYGAYYDFGAHTTAYPDWREDGRFLSFCQEYYGEAERAAVIERLSQMVPIGYRGVIKKDAKADEIRLSSIDDKHTRPMCFISYNQSGYSIHCRQYAEYQEWVSNRNPKRYASNLDKNYDSKNMMHCFRLMHMAAEIAPHGYVHINLDTLRTRPRESQAIRECYDRGQSFVVDNTNPERTDRERYIPDAKAHDYEVIGIFFQSRVRECIARNEKREEKVPVKAIPCTQNKLQLPDYAEGFDKLFFVRINDNEFEITDWRE